MRTLFMTDIHGQYTKAMSLLDSVDYSNEDMLILGGDYFDRGHENDLVASWLESLVGNENVVFLIGNHDLPLVKLLTCESFDEETFLEIEFMQQHNGLDKTIEQLTGSNKKLLDNMSFKEIQALINSRHSKLVDVYSNAVFYYEDSDAIYTHSTLPINYKRASHEVWAEAVWRNPILWARVQAQDFGKDIYIGHYSKTNFDINDVNEEVKIQNVTFCDGGLAWGDRGMIHVRGGDIK